MMPKGHKHSEETKRKMSISRSGDRHWNKGGKAPWVKNLPQIFKKGQVAWNLGVPRTLEERKKMSKNRKGKCLGENNSSWRGGLSFLPYAPEFKESLKLKIRQRDNFVCGRCGKTEQNELQEFSRVLAIHHIDYNKMNCKEDNLISLCAKCNSQVNFEREYWIDFFKKKQTVEINNLLTEGI